MTRTTQLRLTLAISAGLLAGLAAAAASAQNDAQPAPAAAAPTAEEQLDRTPADCILVNRVSNNTGVNDHQVVFSMRGGTYYLNTLDGACQALTPGANRLIFHYATGSAKITRLCDTDSFTVERQTSRIGCSLGLFYPITAAEAAALTGRPLPAAAATPAPASNSGNSRSGGEDSSRRRRDRD